MPGRAHGPSSTCRCASTSGPSSRLQSPASPAPSERELVAPVRRRPDDGAPGHGRAGRRGPARADPRPGHVRRPAAPPGRPADQLHRGHGRRGMLAGVPDAPGPPRAGRPGRRPRAGHHRRATRSSTGSGCAAPTAAPMCIEDAYLNEVLLPGFLQSGDAHQPVRRARAPAACVPTWAEDSITADGADAEEAELLELRPAPRCCVTPAGRWPATSRSRSPAPSTAPTATPSRCSSAGTPRPRAC